MTKFLPLRISALRCIILSAITCTIIYCSSIFAPYFIKYGLAGGMQKLLYGCDDMTYVLAKDFHMTYAEINVFIFVIIEPLFILILGIISILKDTYMRKALATVTLLCGLLFTAYMCKVSGDCLQIRENKICTNNK